MDRACSWLSNPYLVFKIHEHGEKIHTFSEKIHTFSESLPRPPIKVNATNRSCFTTLLWGQHFADKSHRRPSFTHGAGEHDYAEALRGRSAMAGLICDLGMRFLEVSMGEQSWLLVTPFPRPRTAVQNIIYEGICASFCAACDWYGQRSLAHIFCLGTDAVIIISYLLN